MSLKAIERVLRYSQQKGSALAAMLILAHRANGDGICWPKIGSLAGEMNLTLRQTKDLLVHLEEAGEIEIKRNTSGERQANYYLVRVGEDSVPWPEKLPVQRVKCSAGTGDAGFTRSAERVKPSSPVPPRRVKPSTKTGEAQFTRTGEAGCIRVKCSAGTGDAGFTPLKESELKVELKEIPLPTSEESVVVPPSLLAFHSELVGEPGYEPRASFLHQVSQKYGRLDLVEEAMGMVSWMDSPNKKFAGRTPREAGRECGNLFILGWLRKALRTSQEDNHGDSGRGTGGGNGGAADPGKQARGGRLIQRIDD